MALTEQLRDRYRLDAAKISADFLEALIHALRVLDRTDDIRLLGKFGLVPDEPLDDKVSSVPLHSLLTALTELVSNGYDARIGLLMGRKLRISSYGHLSNLLISAPTLWDALDSLCTFYATKVPFVRLSLHDTPGGAVLDCSFMLEAEPEMVNLLVDCIVAAADGVLAFYSCHLKNTALRLLDLSADRVTAYEDILELSPSRGSCSMAIEIPRELLDQVPPLANVELFELALDVCKQIERSRPELASFSAEVAQTIRANPGRDWTQADLSAHFHVSPSTFRRRLAEQGTSYKEILLDVRMGLARQMLGDSELQIARIGEFLGYADSSNFATAFKRATGMSPREFRNNKQP